MSQGPLSSKTYLRKKLKIMNPYKKFMSENIDFWCFRAYIHPKFKIFCYASQVSQKNKFVKKNIFFDEYS